MKEIIESLKATAEELGKIKPATHHTAVAAAQIKSAIEYLERGLKEEQPAAAETDAPIATEAASQ